MTSTRNRLLKHKKSHRNSILNSEMKWLHTRTWPSLFNCRRNYTVRKVIEALEHIMKSFVKPPNVCWSLGCVILSLWGLSQVEKSSNPWSLSSNQLRVKRSLKCSISKKPEIEPRTLWLEGTPKLIITKITEAVWRACLQSDRNRCIFLDVANIFPIIAN